jgi:hypothetical protein
MEDRMKTIKLALAVAALSFSAAAQAMPEQVPDRWHSNMMFRLEVMASNSGFCSAFPQVWICHFSF